MRQPKVLVLTGLILLLFAIRVLPYALKACGLNIEVDVFSGPWNISPLTAVCVLGGIYFGSRKLAVFGPMSAWLLSSVAMSLLTRNWMYVTDPGMLLICGCYLIASLLGTLLQTRSSLTKFVHGMSLALLSECVFFLVTNAGVWLYFPYTAPAYQYPWTVAGLLTCYEAGLPFFKHSLIGTAIFFPLLFGGYALAERKIPALNPSPRPAEA